MIPLAKPNFGKEELDAVKEAFDSGWVAGQGPKNQELARKFADYIGVRHAIPVVNCTAGLHLALLALGIGPGDEVVVPDFTYPATAHAVLYTGAKPVFVDVDIKTYNLNPDLVEEKITPKTKAIIPVHIFGQCAEIRKIKEFAEKHRLFVVEDAACAFGSKHKGIFAGAIGDISCFSFHARKSITSGEGGIIVTNNKKYAEKVQSLVNFGIQPENYVSEEVKIPVFTDLGYNYKLSDIAAAIILKQMNRSSDFIKERIENAKVYNELLKGVPQIKPPHVEEYNIHAYQTFMILLDKKINRNDIIKKMLKKGIQTNIGTYSLHQQPIYENYAKNQFFPNSLELFSHGLALPMFNGIGREQIETVVRELKNAIKE